MKSSKSQTSFMELLGLIGILCLLLLLAWQDLLKQKTGEQKLHLRPVRSPFKELADSIFPSQKTEYIGQGIRTSLKILSKRREKGYILFDAKITRTALISALEQLDADLSAGKPLEEALLKNFELMALEKGGKRQSILLTGYYQPEFPASYEQNKEFSVPVLTRPDDLIAVRLKDFDSRLPPLNLWGRINRGNLKPYFTRAQIEKKLDIYKKFALCWLKTPVDLIELQIQGSGIMLIQGKRHFIHYAANNGRPYTSIGKVLLERGLLKRSDLSWQGIRQWAMEHPRVFREILNKNERYVFFKWEKDGPIGCFGAKLVDGTSAAFDRGIYPPGIPVIVQLNIPTANEIKLPWLHVENDKRLTLLIFNHDTGSAISGPSRTDLYTGTGSPALSLAGRLKNRAKFFILLPKNRPKSIKK